MKAAIHNLGCKVNSYEAQAMEQELIKAGYDIVPFSEDTLADVYIINTCSVTNIADRKSRQMLHKAKKMNPDAVVIAAGCYVQAQGEKLIEDSGIDIIVGNNRKVGIVDTINEYLRDNNAYESLTDISKESEYEQLSIDDVCEHTRAYIKVQDGCNQFCSYCIIPFTRGRVRSRNTDDVIDEIKRLVNKGYKEFVLTGIHLSSYGIDWKINTVDNVSSSEGQDYQGSQMPGSELLELVKRISEVEGVHRIRLGSLEPRIVTEEFTRELAAINAVCPHFHLSLQSGCDVTLKRMNRKYNTAEYAKSCEILRKYFENAAITTDVIVGFPQETEDEFEETRRFLEKIHFFEMHIFKYSRRQGTVADHMSGQVPEPVKASRSSKLLELEASMSREFRSSMLATEQEVLFEEFIDGNIIGHTKNYVRVIVPVTKEEAEVLINTIQKVHLSNLSADGESVVGRIVGRIV